MIELTSKQKGNLTELQCITAFYQNGYAVSIPYGENSRYDFIADINGQLIRVQVKTASIKNNDPTAIEFSCRSTRINAKGSASRRYNEKEIDYFATFWNSQCYLVPVQECSIAKTLRFALPKNGQIKGITFATEYELMRQINKINQKEGNN